MSYLTYSARTLETKPQFQRNDFSTSAELQSFLQFNMFAVVINTPLERTPQVVVINMIKKVVDYVNIRSLLEQDFTTSRGLRVYTGVDNLITVQDAISDWATLPANTIAIQVGGDSGAVADGSTTQISSKFKRLVESLLEEDFKIIR